ncbi:transglutaminase domain-containing protein [Paenibacillus urinalis]|uniref:transglutaminase domain-containing protein n=1 Tax=Paenibacillus urinalis TaxID=521520 RepID=UPI00236896B2|nr:transglutaminase domain-containing protein [Paenibacillus urinalis]WDH98092.1 transglutaminase domain-containing protein [Paenibacillus urinalis]
MRKRRFGLFIVMLLGIVLIGAIPRSVHLHTLYAASNENAITSEELHEVLTSAMVSRTDQFQFTYKGKVKVLKATLQEAIEKAMRSDSYIQYTLKSYAYHYKGTNASAEVNIEFKYRESLEQTAYVNSRVDHILADIIKPGMNDHEKVEAIHNYVVLNLAYDETMQKYTAYDGLATGSTVCQGYSLLTYRMLTEAGITNRIIEGQAGGQLHAWNLLLLEDGVWYHMDTTWDDPTPDQPGKVSYNYYLLTDEEMGQDHTWEAQYPTAVTPYREAIHVLMLQNDDKYAAYKRLYETLNYGLYNEDEIIQTSAQLRERLQSKIDEGAHSVIFRYDGEENELFRELKELYSLGIKSISYYVSDFEETGDLKVKVNWKQ